MSVEPVRHPFHPKTHRRQIHVARKKARRKSPLSDSHQELLHGIQSRCLRGYKGSAYLRLGHSNPRENRDYNLSLQMIPYLSHSQPEYCLQSNYGGTIRQWIV